MRDLSNIDCVSKIEPWESDPKDLSSGFGCFMCLDTVKSGSCIITKRTSKYRDESDEGILTALCDNCLGLILLNKLSDCEIDFSTVDFFSKIYQDLTSVKDKFFESAEEGTILIKNQNYFLIKEQKLNDLEEEFNEICFLRSYTAGIDKIRNEGNPKQGE